MANKIILIWYESHLLKISIFEYKCLLVTDINFKLWESKRKQWFKFPVEKHNLCLPSNIPDRLIAARLKHWHTDINSCFHPYLIKQVAQSRCVTAFVTLHLLDISGLRAIDVIVHLRTMTVMTVQGYVSIIMGTSGWEGTQGTEAGQ